MGRSRSERRAIGGAFNLYAAETALGWRIIDQVEAVYAAEKVALGKWREVFYENGAFAGYQVVPEGERIWNTDNSADYRLPHTFGPPTITITEMMLIAGTKFKNGRSHTKGKPEYVKIRRHAKYDKEKFLTPEDAVERAVAKGKEWPRTHGDRAVRAYPKG